MGYEIFRSDTTGYRVGKSLIFTIGLISESRDSGYFRLKINGSGLMRDTETPVMG